MTTIIRRELGAYFRSPIGYVFLAVFYAFSGYYFYLTSLLPARADISYVFGNMFLIVLFLIPILTMRLFAEDKKYRTDQALLTAPISLTALVLGKYFAAVVMFILAISITLVYGVIVNFFAPPNWGMLFGNYIGMLLLGMALIAICMFISSLTESQVIAATGGFGAALGLVLVDSLNNVVEDPAIASFLQSLSFQRHYSSFQDGIFRFSSFFFFIGITVAFIFLTIRGQERKRWA